MAPWISSYGELTVILISFLPPVMSIIFILKCKALTISRSDRQVCGWPVYRTNFSISWFKPSTELRIGRMWTGGQVRGGIETGLALARVENQRKKYLNWCETYMKPHSYEPWLGLSVWELTECSPRCVRCSLCLITFSIFKSVGVVTSVRVMTGEASADGPEPAPAVGVHVLPRVRSK